MNASIKRLSRMILLRDIWHRSRVMPSPNISY